MSHWLWMPVAKMAVNHLEIHFEMSGCLLQLQIDKWLGLRTVAVPIPLFN